MAGIKGNFYHANGSNIQVIDDVSIINSTIGGIKILSGTAVPTVATLAPRGSLYSCTGTVNLYINTGTATVPVWKAIPFTP